MSLVYNCAENSINIKRIPSGLFGHKCVENYVSIWRIPQWMWCITWISYIYSCFTRMWCHSYIYLFGLQVCREFSKCLENSSGCGVSSESVTSVQYQLHLSNYPAVSGVFEVTHTSIQLIYLPLSHVFDITSKFISINTFLHEPNLSTRTIFLILSHTHNFHTDSLL